MNEKEYSDLVGRVQNAFLFYSTEKQIAEQLRSEGVSEVHIKASLAQGKRLADVRLGKQI